MPLIEKIMNTLFTILFLFIGTNQNIKPTPKVDIIPVVKTARISCYNDYGTTASGITTRKGIVATSDRSIPMGTKIYIEGYGEMLVADKTALWVHNKFGLTFDIYSPDCDKYFGIKHLTYKLL